MPVFLMRFVTLSAFVLSQSANSVACCGYLHHVSTTVAEPPRLPVAACPGVHWGIGSTAHLLESPGKPCAISGAAQTALTSDSTFPFCTSLTQAVSSVDSLVARCLPRSPCQ